MVYGHPKSIHDGPMDIIWTKTMCFLAKKNMCFTTQIPRFQSSIGRLVEALTNLISLHDLTTSRAAQFFGGQGQGLGVDNQNR